MRKLLFVLAALAVCALPLLADFILPPRGSYWADPDGPGGAFPFTIGVMPYEHEEYLEWKGRYYRIGGYGGIEPRWENWQGDPNTMGVCSWVGFDEDGSYVEGTEVWENGEKTGTSNSYGTWSKTK